MLHDVRGQMLPEKCSGFVRVGKDGFEKAIVGMGGKVEIEKRIVGVGIRHATVCNAAGLLATGGEPAGRRRAALTASSAEERPFRAAIR
jgi:hypothetical protein